MADSLEVTSLRYPHPQGEINRAANRHWILSHAKKNGIGAEVGVFRGHYSEIICRDLSPRILYLIDPWEKLGEFFGWGGAYTANNTLPTKVALDETKARVAKFPQVEVRVIQGSFPEDKSQIKEPLDWIYLDAGHQFERTRWELMEAAKAIAPDGVIMGDDWIADRNHEHHGVFRAVNWFVKNSEFEIVSAGIAAQWCIRRSAA